MEQAQILRIVVASPSDVRPERDAVERVATELNRGIAVDRGLQLEVVHWEMDRFPGFFPQSPQGWLQPILSIEDCEVLIGIFWKRFGTPTVDGIAGAEHEFRTAYEAWQRKGRPQIMVYFNKRRHAPKSEAEAEQWGRVLKFKENFPKEGLSWDYNGKAQFEELVRNHLTQWILRHVLPPTPASEQRESSIVDGMSGAVKEPRPPRVYISYSWDSSEHKKRVRELADRLRREGIESYIDQYEVVPMGGWARWQQTQVRSADFVLLVCTEGYKHRVENVPGSGSYDDVQLMLKELAADPSKSAKFIPIGFGSYVDNRAFIPSFLDDTFYYNVAAEESYVGLDYDDLYYRLISEPQFVPPPVGPRRPRIEREATSAAPSPPLAVPVGSRREPGAEHTGSGAIPLARRDKVFVSYSHKDAKWLARLQTVLKPLVRQEVIDLWDDTIIQPGERWQEKIEQALASAKVAVLLVSQEFLASDFIAHHELPPLLKTAEQEGATILWVPVTSCLYEETEIREYQAAHSPDRPLDSLTPAERNRALTDIAKKIKAAVAANPR